MTLSCSFLLRKTSFRYPFRVWRHTNSSSKLTFFSVDGLLQKSVENDSAKAPILSICCCCCRCLWVDCWSNTNISKGTKMGIGVGGAVSSTTLYRPTIYHQVVVYICSVWWNIILQDGFFMVLIIPFFD